MTIVSIIICLFAFSANATHLISTTKKPVILLDVDGVINIIGTGKIWGDIQTKKVATNGEFNDVRYSPSMIDSINKLNKNESAKNIQNS